jgi:hypothetical protein
MVIIYCIEDINDLKYVGSTKQKLEKRLNQHKDIRTDGKKCSSKKLNLYNCIIYPLEECEEDLRKEKERYWINRIDCVNTLRLNFNQRQYNNAYRREWRKKKKLLN